MSKQYKYGYSICKNYSIFMFKILKPFTHEVIIQSPLLLVQYLHLIVRILHSLMMKDHCIWNIIRVSIFLKCFKIEAFKHIWLLFLFVCFNFWGFFVCVFFLLLRKTTISKLFIYKPDVSRKSTIWFFLGTSQNTETFTIGIYTKLLFFALLRRRFKTYYNSDFPQMVICA